MTRLAKELIRAFRGSHVKFASRQVKLEARGLGILLVFFILLNADRFTPLIERMVAGVEPYII